MRRGPGNDDTNWVSLIRVSFVLLSFSTGRLREASRKTRDRKTKTTHQIARSHLHQSRADNKRLASAPVDEASYM